MNQPKPYVIIGTPFFGSQMSHLYALSVLKLQRACYQGGKVGFNLVSQLGDALIPRARQDIMTRFMGIPNATHLLFVDADVAFEPEQVFRLLEAGVDMAAGAYPDKALDLVRLEALAKANHHHPEAAALRYGFETEDPQKIEVKKGFAKVKRTGMGFTLIRRQVFTRMMERYPELKYSGALTVQDPLMGNPNRYALFDCMIDPKTHVYLGEDQSFCDRWTRMGGEIWVDLQSRLGHVGPMVFEGDLSSQIKPEFLPAPPPKRIVE